MRRNFEALRRLSFRRADVRDPKVAMRIVLGVLLLLNLTALGLMLWPPGGSADSLEEQLLSLRSQLAQKKAAAARAREHAAKLEKSRESTQEFEGAYFTDRRVASSTFVAELARAARESGVRPKEHLFVFDPIEGSDVLSMMTINANYEGTYADLLAFINRLDRSARFLILDSLGAAPQQGSGILNITLKLNAFVKEGSGQL